MAMDAMPSSSLYVSLSSGGNLNKLVACAIDEQKHATVVRSVAAAGFRQGGSASERVHLRVFQFHPPPK